MPDKFKKIRSRLSSTVWTLGFIEGPVENLLVEKNPEIHWLKTRHRGGWFADPFILDVTEDAIFLLVEEFVYSENKGVISLLEVGRKDYDLRSTQKILSSPSHLSFPAILRKDGKVYLYPENSESGKLDLYEFDFNNRSCTFVKTLVADALTDAVLTSVFGKDTIFATALPNPNGNELKIFSDNGECFSEAMAHLFDSSIARNAGNWFVIGDEVYRPAQDCNSGYGGGVIIQKVIKSNDDYKFEDVTRINPLYKFYDLGCHTLNHYKNVSAIDVHGFRWPYIVKPISAILKWFRCQ